MQRVQERQDHFVAAVVADSDKTRLQDPRHEDNDEPIATGAADGAAPSTPVGGEGVTKFFDIGGDSPLAQPDEEMNDDGDIWADGPAVLLKYLSRV